MDFLSVDGRHELLVIVDASLVPAPVPAIEPVLDELLHVRKWDAVLPAGVGKLVGPARSRQALAQIVEVGLRDVDAKRSDLGVAWHEALPGSERNDLFRYYHGGATE